MSRGTDVIRAAMHSHRHPKVAAIARAALWVAAWRRAVLVHARLGPDEVLTELGRRQLGRMGPHAARAIERLAKLMG